MLPLVAAFIDRRTENYSAAPRTMARMRQGETVADMTEDMEPRVHSEEEVRRLRRMVEMFQGNVSRDIRKAPCHWPAHSKVSFNKLNDRRYRKIWIAIDLRQKFADTLQWAHEADV